MVGTNVSTVAVRIDAAPLQGLTPPTSVAVHYSGLPLSSEPHTHTHTHAHIYMRNQGSTCGWAVGRHVRGRAREAVAGKRTRRAHALSLARSPCPLPFRWQTQREGTPADIHNMLLSTQRVGGAGRGEKTAHTHMYIYVYVSAWGGGGEDGRRQRKATLQGAAQGEGEGMPS